MAIKLRDVCFMLGVLWSTYLPPGFANKPDLMMVYNMTGNLSSIFPSCVLQNKSQELQVKLLRSSSDDLHLGKGSEGKFDFNQRTVKENMTRDTYGFECSALNETLKVLGPVVTSYSSVFLPSLSVILNESATFDSIVNEDLEFAFGKDLKKRARFVWKSSSESIKDGNGLYIVSNDSAKTLVATLLVSFRDDDQSCNFDQEKGVLHCLPEPNICYCGKKYKGFTCTEERGPDDYMCKGKQDQGSLTPKVKKTSTMPTTSGSTLQENLTTTTEPITSHTTSTPKYEMQDQGSSTPQVKKTSTMPTTSGSTLQENLTNTTEPITSHTTSTPKYEVPKVKGKPKKLKSPKGMFRMELPQVGNPPAVQYVVAAETREGFNDSRVKSLALKIVKEEIKSAKNRSETKEREKRSRNMESNTNDPVAWIAKKININTTSNMNVILSSGQEGDRKWVAKKDYKVVVVTEKKLGGQSTFAVSEPINASVSAVGGALSGAMFGCIVFLVLILIAIWSYRVRRRANARKLIIEEDPPLPMQEFDDLGKAQAGRLGKKEKELKKSILKLPKGPLAHVEDNLPMVNSRRIPSDIMEGYLSRAIHSEDTNMEFNSIPKLMKTCCSHGEHAENRSKNRRREYVPYNDTRVKLPRLPDVPFSDYINASFIKDHEGQNAYIATQGPKSFNKNTIDDFWRMIWFSNSHTIVMLASLMENGMVTLPKYWPTEEPITKGGVNISLQSTETKEHFILRTLLLSQNGQNRKVLHYQYTAWPNCGVPKKPFGLAQMLECITDNHETGPIVVLCHDGIGRTGTILLAMVVLGQIKKTRYMDAPEALIILRNGRPGLVETEMQYNFAHRLVNSILFEEETGFCRSDFAKALTDLRTPQANTNMSIIQQQFHKIKSLPKNLTFNVAKMPKNAPANRNSSILPGDNQLVTLKNQDDTGEPTYVNALWVRNVELKDTYLVGEHPQKHTLAKIWRIVYEEEVKVWTLIHSFPANDQNYPEIIPKDGNEKFGAVEVSIFFYQEHEDFTEYHLVVQLTNETSETRNCVVLMMNGWPYSEPQPRSLSSLLAVMEKAKSIMQDTEVGLFTCKDGATGCGLLMALLNVIDRMNLVNEVDVYRSALAITYDRPEFITSEAQYELVHDAVLQYLQPHSD